MFDASPQEYVGRSLLRPSRPPRHLSWQIDQQDLAGRGAPDLEHRLTLDRGGVALTEGETMLDRKSTRLNSSHVRISYAVFCLKKKKKKRERRSFACCMRFFISIDAHTGRHE